MFAGVVVKLLSDLNLAFEKNQVMTLITTIRVSTQALIAFDRGGKKTKSV